MVLRGSGGCGGQFVADDVLCAARRIGCAQIFADVSGGASLAGRAIRVNFGSRGHASGRGVVSVLWHQSHSVCRGDDLGDGVVCAAFASVPEEPGWRARVRCVRCALAACASDRDFAAAVGGCGGAEFARRVSIPRRVGGLVCGSYRVPASSGGAFVGRSISFRECPRRFGIARVNCGAHFGSAKPVLVSIDLYCRDHAASGVVCVGMACAVGAVVDFVGIWRGDFRV